MIFFEDSTDDNGDEVFSRTFKMSSLRQPWHTDAQLLDFHKFYGGKKKYESSINRPDARKTQEEGSFFFTQFLEF